MHFTWVKGSLVLKKQDITPEILRKLSDLAEGAFVLDQDPFLWVGKQEVPFQVPFEQKYA